MIVNNISKTKIYSGLLLVYLGILIYLSLQAPSASFSNKIFDFENADKVKHFVAYFILAVLLAKQYRKFYAFSFAVSLGILLEILQIYTGRHFSFGDIAANSLGALVGIMINYVLLQKSL